jgi:hypothetical protein
MGEVDLRIFFQTLERTHLVCGLKVPYAQGETFDRLFKRLQESSEAPRLFSCLKVERLTDLNGWNDVERNAVVTSARYDVYLKPQVPLERRVRPRIQPQVEMTLSIDGRFFSTLKVPVPEQETSWADFIEFLRESSQIARNVHLVSLKVYPYMGSICVARPVYPGTFALNFSFSEPRTPENSPEFVPYRGQPNRLT